MHNLFCALLAFVTASWLFHRPADENVRDGIATFVTIDLLTSHGDETAQDLAFLWQLDAEHQRALRDAEDSRE